MTKTSKMDLLSRPWVIPAAVAVVAASLLLPLLGSSGLWDPNESLAAEVVREIAREGSWFPLRFDGDPVWGLPPLLFWVQALFMSVAGTSEWAVRLPAALMATGLLSLIAHQGSRGLDRPTGALASLALLTSAFVLTGARHTSPDTLASLLTASAALQLITVLNTDEKVSKLDVMLAHVLGGALLLGAGPIPVLALGVALGSGAALGTVPVSRLRRLAGRWVWIPWSVAGVWLLAGSIAGGTEFLASVVSVNPFAHSAMLSFVQGPDTSFTWQIQQIGHMAYPWLVGVPAALLWLVAPRTDEEPGRSTSRIVTLHVLLAVPLTILAVACMTPGYLPLDTICGASFLPIISAWGMTRIIRVYDDEGYRSLLPLGGILVMLGVGSQGVDFFWLPKRVLEVGGYMFDRVYPELGPSAKGMHTGVAILVGAAAAPMTFFRRWPWLLGAAMLLGAFVLGGYHVVYVFEKVEPYLSVGPLARAYADEKTDRDLLVAVELDDQVRGGHVFYFEREMRDIGELPALRKTMDEAAGKHRLVIVTSHVRELYNDVYTLSCGGRIDPLNEERRWYAISAFEGAPTMGGYRTVVPGGRAEARIDHPSRMALYHDAVHTLDFLGWSAQVGPADASADDDVAGSIRVPRGGWLEMSLVYRVVAPMKSSFRVLLDAIRTGPSTGSGTIKGHHLPACGRYPTTDWKPGEVVMDRYYLYVDHDQAVGNYRLRTGIYRTGDRMMVDSPGGTKGPARKATIDLTTIVVY